MSINDLALSSAHGSSPQDLWMILLVRMITRTVSLGPEDEGHSDGSDSVDLEKIREILFNYTMADFPSRLLCQETCGRKK